MLADVTDFGFECLPVFTASDAFAKQGQLSLIDGVEPQQHLDERRLPRTVGTQQPDDLSAAKLHIDVVISHKVSKTLRQPPGLHDNRRYLDSMLPCFDLYGRQGAFFLKCVDKEKRFECRLGMGGIHTFKRITSFVEAETACFR